MTFLQQPTSPVQMVPPPSQPAVTTSQTPQPYEPRTTPTNLTTFQANVPLATFQASDKSSISPASSSLGYAKDSPVSSSLGQNSSVLYNHEKLSPSGSERIGQTTPLVYAGSQKRAPKSPSNSRLQELAISAFNHTYNVGGAQLPESAGIANCDGGLHDECNDGLDRDLNPQWEFQSTIEAANYTILSDWSPARDYLIDDFTILGFRPQDEITTEL